VAGERRQKSFTLPRGIFVLRYEEAGDRHAPPSVSVTCEPGRNAAILHPDSSQAVLSRPGTGIVIHAKAEGTVVLEIFSEFANGSLEATLKCEPINQVLDTKDGNSARSGAAYSAKEQRPSANYEISVLGHVARLGDTMVAANEWLAGPSAPSRIEGLEIHWPRKPRDAELTYGVRLAGDRPETFRSSDEDAFVGTRGRAVPIIGAYFELSGSVAKTHQLVVESLFLSGTPRRQSGAKVKISGPTGQEPLVGLRLMVASSNALPVIDDAARETSPRRVRVFRAG
jgi:hypothetical protein